MHVRDVPDKNFHNAYAAAERIEWTPNPICWPGGIERSKLSAEDRMKMPFFRLISQTNSLQQHAGTPVCRQNISMPKKIENAAAATYQTRNDESELQNVLALLI